jgi:alpha-methylacyl-CoA racemase
VRGQQVVSGRTGPLAGLRVVELAGIGPCPFAAMLLGDLGADVLRVERAEAVATGTASSPADLLQRNKASVGVDLKSAQGREFVLECAAVADVVLEGFRPGVVERLGVGPDECRARNPRLVYGRMTGWGQEGPLAQRAGHDIDYIALAGALAPIGREGEAPVPPLNLLGDFGGGGLLLAFGVLAALVEVSRSGQGQVVDAAMVDGAALLTTFVWGLRHLGVWRDERGTNLLDTGAPFYEVYECADGRFVAVGALEPRFYAELCDLLDLDPAQLPSQMERAAWPQLKALFAERFRTRPRDEWVALAEGRDACLAPVLEMAEAPLHPHNRARGTFLEVEGLVQPAPAPRFSRSSPGAPSPPARPGEGGDALAARWGVSAEVVSAAVATGSLRTCAPR